MSQQSKIEISQQNEGHVGNTFKMSQQSQII